MITQRTPVPAVSGESSSCPPRRNSPAPYLHGGRRWRETVRRLRHRRHALPVTPAPAPISRLHVNLYVQTPSRHPATGPIKAHLNFRPRKGHPGPSSLSLSSFNVVGAHLSLTLKLPRVGPPLRCSVLPWRPGKQGKLDPLVKLGPTLELIDRARSCGLERVDHPRVGAALSNRSAWGQLWPWRKLSYLPYF